MTRSDSKKKKPTGPTMTNTKESDNGNKVTLHTTSIDKHSTPVKKKPKTDIKKSPKKPPKDVSAKSLKKYDVIYTESIGEFIVGTVYRQDGKPGYVYPVLQAIRSGNSDLTNVDMFDCRIQNRNLFIRQSRERDKKLISMFQVDSCINLDLWLILTEPS